RRRRPHRPEGARGPEALARRAERVERAAVIADVDSAVLADDGLRGDAPSGRVAPASLGPGRTAEGAAPGAAPSAAIERRRALLVLDRQLTPRLSGRAIDAGLADRRLVRVDLERVLARRLEHQID